MSRTPTLPGPKRLKEDKQAGVGRRRLVPVGMATCSMRSDHSPSHDSEKSTMWAWSLDRLWGHLSVLPSLLCLDWFAGMEHQHGQTGRRC